MDQNKLIHEKESNLPNHILETLLKYLCLNALKSCHIKMECCCLILKSSLKHHVDKEKNPRRLFLLIDPSMQFSKDIYLSLFELLMSCQGVEIVAYDKN